MRVGKKEVSHQTEYNGTQYNGIKWEKGIMGQLCAMEVGERMKEGGTRMGK